MRITLDIIKKIYPLAKDVFEQRINKYEARDTLVKNAGMKPASAMMHLYAFMNMMEGECYKRSINGPATEYFLKMIHADYGQEALKTALSSADKHIKHCQKEGWGGRHNIRKIHDKFSKLV